MIPPIIYENTDCIVLNKPSGLLSVPDRKQLLPNLKDILITKYGDIYTVHRLDAPTSGIIIFAKNAETHKQLSHQFENRLTKKLYLGIVHGALPDNEGTWDTPILEHPGKNGTMVAHRNGKASITNYKVLHNLSKYSILQFDILTGRTHQIRVHCKNAGYPIVADTLYGDGKGIMLSTLKKRFNLSKNELDEKPILNRLALHAQYLTVIVNGVSQTFEAPIPKDINVAIKILQKHC